MSATSFLRPAALAFGFFLLTASLRAAPPREKDFKHDLNYYRRTAKIKKLAANDRLYILNRLREKYKEAEFDLSDLYAEIDRWSARKEEKKEPQAKPAVSEKEAPAAEPGKKEAQGILQKIFVSDREEGSQVILKSPGTAEYKEILKRDESGREPPVLVLYLYNTRQALPPASEDIALKGGLLRRVQTSLISKEPPTVRVAVSLRQDSPYQVRRQPDGLIVAVLKEPPAPTAEAAPSNISTAAVIPVIPAAAQPLLQPEELPNEAGTTAIEPGDILNIDISPAEDLSQQKIVQTDGNIQVLLAGVLHAAGLTVDELEAQLTKRLSRTLTHPKVIVTVKRSRERQVYLSGSVRKPGAYAYGKALGCYELISRTGGFLAEADKKNVMIYRGGKGERQLLTFDAAAYLAAEHRQDLPLEAGDVVEVPRAANFVYVIGAVKQQGRYDLAAGLKLMQAIYGAGGFEPEARTDQVRVVRETDGKKMVQEIDARAVMNNQPERDIELKAGDLIVVPQKGALKPRYLKRGVLPWGIFLASVGLVLALLI